MNPLIASLLLIVITGFAIAYWIAMNKAMSAAEKHREAKAQLRLAQQRLRITEDAYRISKDQYDLQTKTISRVDELHAKNLSGVDAQASYRTL